MSPAGGVFLIVCDVETSKMRRPRPELVCCATGGKNDVFNRMLTINMYNIIHTVFIMENQFADCEVRSLLRVSA